MSLDPERPRFSIEEVVGVGRSAKKNDVREPESRSMTEPFPLSFSVTLEGCCMAWRERGE
ncbi:hypothetical protein E2C01_011645 [Portunus trituberculatus]|uniref:Uncharacterized protein n=1 Tax=Portunus trituberculatus TaxID=210409 RepID=A0A5B7DBV2_PORTR|nr:hypothetical protein [Portunus trituberculatus]